jgi:SAM-dependent methyltransferase
MPISCERDPREELSDIGRFGCQSAILIWFGQIIDGIQHEDIQTLSFDNSNSTLDLVVSNDVMEHVPSPSAAFGELARVMRPGAVALMTFPFFAGNQSSVVRAEVINGEIVHRCDPVYHGNPIDSEGSLVFTDFGWDILDLIRAQGFNNVDLEIYHSVALGHLGGGSLVFRLTR